MTKSRVWIVVFASMVLIPGNAMCAQLLFTPRISVTQEYNDNIDLDRRNKQDDFITTVSPGFTAELLGQTAGLSLSYDPAYLFYADNSDNDYWRHVLNARLWNDFSRSTRLEIQNNFLYSQDPLDDDDVEDQQGNIVVRGNDRRRAPDTYWRNRASARLNHRFGVEDRTYAQLVYGINEFDNPDDEDSQEIEPSAGLVYWFTQWTGMSVDGVFTRGLYDENEDSSDFSNYDGRVRLNQRISRQFGLFGQYRHIYRDWDEEGIVNTDGDVDNNYSVYAPSAGVFYDFDRDLTASLGLGWFYQQIENEEDQDGPFVSADINKLWEAPGWSLRARGSSGLDSEDFSDRNGGFRRFAQAELIGRYDLTRQLFCDAGLRYRYSDFIQAADDEKDHRYTANIGLGYRLFRWMSVRLGYEFDKLDNINGDDDYERNRVFATVTLESDVPWRLGDW
ncbi:MAG TPA: outer membrane beta-barrel protein [Desulfobacterales bacterium]|nr:outer membrane beta-barrel protein [Desulfobacterales bacterium]